MTTIQQALEKAKTLQQVSASAQLDAELLLASAIQQRREYLFTWPEQTLSDAQLELFAGFCRRRTRGEPVAYILGRQAFWDFELKVSPAVLIPRPETELLVEAAIALLTDEGLTQARIVDLGTGSGAIALALAVTNKHWQLTAVDNSEQALALAIENANALKLTNIEFRHASWCEGLAPKQFDLIAANPPYVEEGDEHLRQGSLPFEPLSALVAKDKGLADIRAIAEQAKHCLKKDAWLFIEHGFAQKAAVEAILRHGGYDNIECLQDLAQLDIMTKAQFRF